jgi:hypothetical protein
MEIQSQHEQAEREVENGREQTQKLDGLTAEIGGIKDALSGLGGLLAQKKKPKGITLQKLDGKTNKVMISFDDGTNEEMSVN